MGRAYRAWIAWKEGDVSAAQIEARAAVEAIPHAYPYRWVALWPLVGAATALNQIPEAIDHVRALVAPTQQPMPDGLERQVEAAIQAWDTGQPEQVRACLEQVVTSAREAGYL